MNFTNTGHDGQQQEQDDAGTLSAMDYTPAVVDPADDEAVRAQARLAIAHTRSMAGAMIGALLSGDTAIVPMFHRPTGTVLAVLAGEITGGGRRLIVPFALLLSGDTPADFIPCGADGTVVKQSTVRCAGLPEALFHTTSPDAEGEA